MRRLFCNLSYFESVENYSLRCNVQLVSFCLMHESWRQYNKRLSILYQCNVLWCVMGCLILLAVVVIWYTVLSSRMLGIFFVCVCWVIWYILSSRTAGILFWEKNKSLQEVESKIAKSSVLVCQTTPEPPWPGQARQERSSTAVGWLQPKHPGR